MGSCKTGALFMGPATGFSRASGKKSWPVQAWVTIGSLLAVSLPLPFDDGVFAPLVGTRPTSVIRTRAAPAVQQRHDQTRNRQYITDQSRKSDQQTRKHPPHA